MRQVEAHLLAEKRQRSHAGAVVAPAAGLDKGPQQTEILLFGMDLIQFVLPRPDPPPEARPPAIS
jgi:hypothetical protein